jgi:hypothetical protein
MVCQQVEINAVASLYQFEENDFKGVVDLVNQLCLG